MAFGRGTVVGLALAVTLVGGACGPDVCTADVACYAGGIVDTSSLTAPIASLTADPSCSVTNDGEVLVMVNGSYGNPTSGSCQIHATLTDGIELGGRSVLGTRQQCLLPRHEPQRRPAAKVYPRQQRRGGVAEPRFIERGRLRRLTTWCSAASIRPSEARKDDRPLQHHVGQLSV